MARVIYGVCGHGTGHSSRSKEVISFLEKRGHEVLVLGHERSYHYLREHFDTREIEGFTLAYSTNRISFPRTTWENIKRFPARNRAYRKIDALFRNFRPNIAFTDFEQLTPLVARKHRVPVVSLDCQHRLTNMYLNYPGKYWFQALVTNSVIRWMIPDPLAYLISTFFFSRPRNQKSFFYHPVIRTEVINLKPEQKDYILVYQTSHSNSRILEILKKIDRKFIVYGFNVDGKKHNLEFKKFSKVGFLEDLKNCTAVITNGGFTLMSESIFLGKPVLSEPIWNQFEQVLNAFYLDKLGYGKHVERLGAESISRFISQIPLYAKRLGKVKHDKNANLLRKVESLVQNYA